MAKSTRKESAGHYRKVRSTLWGDRKFRELPGLDSKGLFVLVMVHPNMTSLGAMRGTLPGLAAELDVSAEAFREAFREVLDKGMVEVDEKACLITYPNFVRHNEPESPNVVLSWSHVILSLPECPLLYRHIHRCGTYIQRMDPSFSKAFREALGKAFPEGLGKSIANTETETERETDTDQPPPPCDRGSNSADGGGGGNEIYEPAWSKVEELLTKLADGKPVEN